MFPQFWESQLERELERSWKTSILVVVAARSSRVKFNVSLSAILWNSRRPTSKTIPEIYATFPPGSVYRPRKESSNRERRTSLKNRYARIRFVETRDGLWLSLSLSTNALRVVSRNITKKRRVTRATRPLFSFPLDRVFSTRKFALPGRENSENATYIVPTLIGSYNFLDNSSVIILRSPR